jgi:hypothetical protein
MAVRMGGALMGIIAAWCLGYRDAAFIAAATCIFLFLWLGGLFIGALVIPPKLERLRGKSIGETMSFHLADKQYSDKRGNPLSRPEPK